jgi:hypothetical protein
MSDTKLVWYSVNRDLAVEEHDPVGLDEALVIVDRYFATAGQRHDRGEDAIAATTFGFSRSKSDFIEIGVHRCDQISYRFEACDPKMFWLRRLFGGVFEREQELHSREELVQKVIEFFTSSVAEIRHRF